MKTIVAVIRQEKFEAVSKDLIDNGFHAMTTFPVHGRGEQGGISLQHRGASIKISLIPKTRLEITVRDNEVDNCIKIICDAAKTGKFGDGKIFVYDVARVVRVRTGREEYDPLTTRSEE
jgi:nitrogen regulatory protein P-II 1